MRKYIKYNTREISKHIENQKTLPIKTNYLNYSDLIQGSKDSILLLCQFFSNQSKYNVILIKISVGILQNVSKIHMEIQSQLKERSYPGIWKDIVQEIINYVGKLMRNKDGYNAGEANTHLDH